MFPGSGPGPGAALAACLLVIDILLAKFGECGRMQF